VIPGSKTTIGTCGLCAGPVSVPNVWMGIIPPQPACESCGATAAPNHGPTLPMNPPRQLRYGTSTNTSGTECCVR
jgi:hypothetical protein